MSAFVHPFGDFDLSGKHFILPVVSTANVSQLAVDLLITSLSLKRVALVDPKYFIPAVGGRDDGEAGVTVSLELYSHQNLNIVVAQQRSPVLKLYKQDFIDALVEFVQSSKCASFLLLSGIDLVNRTDSQMGTPTYYVLPPQSPSSSLSSQGVLQNIAKFGIPEYKPSTSQHPSQPATAEQQPDSNVPFIPGGGLTRRILASLPSSSYSIPTAALVQFALEGDNRVDANFFAAVVAKVLDLEVSQWRQPDSWKRGLFGTPHDQTLYG